ncbi:right-handed parallel beta-helix repeat-containing protein [Neobacillus sp. BF23-41]|uniref:right-handed parallel beta-helix repeat-containing protein n=1 Tax=Neobacillus sp. BF23-41 TaxID=3240280 RepID=UPI0034E3A219
MAIIVVPKDAPTIQSAVIDAMSDDLIFVKKGNYNESVDIIGKSIAIIAEKGAILDGENSLLYGFRVANSNIEIKGFKIQNYLEYGIKQEGFSQIASYIENTIQNIGKDGITIVNNSDSLCVIWKNKIRKISENGINIQNAFATNVLIIQNAIEDVLNNGINVTSFERAGTIFENIIRKVGNEGIVFQFINSAAVLGNKISHARQNGISTNGQGYILSKNDTKYNGSNGLEVNGAFDGINYIEENTSSDNKKDGISINQDNNFIIRNKAKDNGDDGIDLNSNNNEVVENFVCNNGDKDIENNGVNNQFFRNEVCDDSILDAHDHHHHESSDESSS